MLFSNSFTSDNNLEPEQLSNYSSPELNPWVNLLTESTTQLVGQGMWNEAKPKTQLRNYSRSDHYSRPNQGESSLRPIRKQRHATILRTLLIMTVRVSVIVYLRLFSCHYDYYHVVEYSVGAASLVRCTTIRVCPKNALTCKWCGSDLGKVILIVVCYLYW